MLFHDIMHGFTCARFDREAIHCQHVYQYVDSHDRKCCYRRMMKQMTGCTSPLYITAVFGVEYEVRVAAVGENLIGAESVRTIKIPEAG